MGIVAEVRMWGRTIGAVSIGDGEEIANFEYDSAFAQSGIEISPLHMPLSSRIYRFPQLSRQTFHGLPGLLAGAYSYEQSLQVMRQLGLPMASIEQQFMRMVFNVIARNQDDHVKNIAFLMNKKGEWSLSPAYDLTYSYNPDGHWTGLHQMSLNGKRDRFLRDDFKACAQSVSMKRGVADEILTRVRDVVSRWKVYADEAGVPSGIEEKIARTLRLEIF